MKINKKLLGLVLFSLIFLGSTIGITTQAYYSQSFKISSNEIKAAPFNFTNSKQFTVLNDEELRPLSEYSISFDIDSLDTDLDHYDVSYLIQLKLKGELFKDITEHIDNATEMRDITVSLKRDNESINYSLEKEAEEIVLVFDKITPIDKVDTYTISFDWGLTSSQISKKSAQSDIQLLVDVIQEEKQEVE